ncbi:MAG TPA: hypothetical protein VGQ69_02910 [Gemmatimonadales bacterium]|jgi:hypothetical protein|nr:hypothetical protein [Gemmatimonadales bacterium]
MMADLLDVIVSWRTFLVALAVFGFAPGALLRLIVLAFPRDDPRRSELLAELHAVPRLERPFWVCEQLEVALFEGVRERVLQANTRVALYTYVLGVSVTGFTIAILVTMSSGGLRAARDASLSFWILVLYFVIAGILEIRMPSPSKERMIDLQIIFIFPLLLGWGIGATMLALVLGTLISELAIRRSMLRMVFNVAQSSLALAVAGAAYRLVGGGFPFTVGDLLALGIALVAFGTINHGLVSIVVAIARSTPLMAELRSGARFMVGSVLIPFSLAPVVLITAQRSIVFVFLLCIPAGGIYYLMRKASDAIECTYSARQS